MAPVGIVWEGYVCEGGVAVVAKYRRRYDLAAFGLPLHTGEIRGLYDGVYIWYLHWKVSCEKFSVAHCFCIDDCSIHIQIADLQGFLHDSLDG